MLDYEKLVVNGKTIDFGIVSSDTEITTGTGGKVLVLNPMDASTYHKQADELCRLEAPLARYAIMFPDPSNKTQYDLVTVDQGKYAEIKAFSIRALTVN